ARSPPGKERRRSNPGYDRDRRSAVLYQDRPAQECGKEEQLPLALHFQYTISENTTIMATRHRAGVRSGSVHSGFCVPSRCSRRISCNILRASESSHWFVASSTALSVSSSALTSARNR